MEVAGLRVDPCRCLSSEEPPLDLTGKVYQLEVMLKQLHTDLQKVRPTGCRQPHAWHAQGSRFLASPEPGMLPS